jgi:DNA-binding XRE family transcriptional regulator
VIHRNLVETPGATAQELSSAAVLDILDRGDLGDWRPIAVAIAEQPFGELAERVLKLVDAAEMYGASALWRAWIHRCRARAEGPIRPMADLVTLRRRLGLTQVDLSTRLGMSQSDLSKLERRDDVKLSTLKAHLAAVGGRLRVICETRGREVEVAIPGKSRRRRRGSRPPSR